MDLIRCSAGAASLLLAAGILCCGAQAQEQPEFFFRFKPISIVKVPGASDFSMPDLYSGESADLTLPAPLEQPLFTETPPATPTNIPTGLLILSLGLFGFFGAVISYLRGR